MRSGGLIPFAFLFVLLVINWYGIVNETVLISVLPAVGFLAVFMATHLNLWFLLTLSIFASYFYIAPLSNATDLFFLSAVGCATITFLRNVFFRVADKNDSLVLLRVSVLSILAVLIYTVSFRGFGLRIFGSPQWGGAQYLEIFVCIGFFLSSSSVQLPWKHLKKSIIILCFLSFSVFVVQLIHQFVSESLSSALESYIRLSSSFNISLYELQKTSSVLRLQPAMFAAPYMLLLGLLMLKEKIRGNLKFLIFFLFAFILAGISGHRIAMLRIVLITFFYLVLEKSIDSKKMILGFGTMLFLSLVFLVMFANHLPLSFQRMIAWIPFADISYLARESAQSTSEWRIDMWRILLEQEVPKYLWLGKGFLWDFSEAYANTQIGAATSFFIATHQYHSGPLFLLVDLGVWGFVSVTCFVIFTIKTHLKYLHFDWRFEDAKNAHTVFLAVFISEAALFYLVFGGISSLVRMIFYVTVLDFIAKTRVVPTKQCR